VNYSFKPLQLDNHFESPCSCLTTGLSFRQNRIISST